MATAPPSFLISKDSIRQMLDFIDGVDQKYQATFRNMHQGYPEPTLVRYLKAREGDVEKANKMIMDCLKWRVQNDIDNILAKPIERSLYESIRNSQLIGVSGYCKKGRPVFAIGVGQSGYDKASVDKFVQSHIQINEYRDRVVLPQATRKEGRHIGSCVKILDMTGLKMSALGRMKILTVISTVDDLNYPEKTDVYYIVNAPIVFTACWKAVKPMLQERTKKKIQVLRGCGREELLKVMDLDAIPLFARVSGSSKNIHELVDPANDCFSPQHQFHAELWNHIQRQAELRSQMTAMSQASVHVKVPMLDRHPGGSTDVVHMIESTLEQLKAEANVKDMDMEKLLSSLANSTKLSESRSLGIGANGERMNGPPRLHRA